MVHRHQAYEDPICSANAWFHPKLQSTLLRHNRHTLCNYFLYTAQLLVSAYLIFFEDIPADSQITTNLLHALNISVSRADKA